MPTAHAEKIAALRATFRTWLKWLPEGVDGRPWQERCGYNCEGMPHREMAFTCAPEILAAIKVLRPLEVSIAEAGALLRILERAADASLASVPRQCFPLLPKKCECDTVIQMTWDEFPLELIAAGLHRSPSQVLARAKELELGDPAHVFTTHGIAVTGGRGRRKATRMIRAYRQATGASAFSEFLRETGVPSEPCSQMDVAEAIYGVGQRANNRKSLVSSVVTKGGHFVAPQNYDQGSHGIASARTARAKQILSPRAIWDAFVELNKPETEAEAACALCSRLVQPPQYLRRGYCKSCDRKRRRDDAGADSRTEGT